MSRFDQKSEKSSLMRNSLIICLFLAICTVFYLCIDSLSESTVQRQYENLRTSLNTSIVECYAAEGSYPESLDYIRSNYGLVYDSSRFYIDYHPRGSNIMPDVTILLLDEDGNTEKIEEEAGDDQTRS